MVYEGVLSEPHSDEEQVVLRAVDRAPAFLPQDLVVAPGAEHRLPRSGHFTMTPPSEAPQGRMRIGELAYASMKRRILDHLDGTDLRMAAAVPSRTCAATHNPDWKLS